MLLTMIFFAFIKFVIVVISATRDGQQMQLYRAYGMMGILLTVAIILIRKPNLVKIASHIMLGGALAIIWSSLFIFAQQLTVVIIQIILLTAMLSYYLVGGRIAAIYTSLILLPVILALMGGPNALTVLRMPSQELAQPMARIIIALNFITFMRVHYLYYRAFNRTLKEKEELNTQLHEHVKTTQALADSRSLFLSTMSHELRTPLHGIIGMAHLLKDAEPGQQREQLEILEFSANNLLTVINDVLDYNKIELNHIELENIPVNLGTLIRQTASGIELKAREKGLSLILRTDELLDRNQVLTDPTRLAQILYNLLGNAVKFTESGTVTLELKAIPQANNNLTIDFIICDTGIGIAADRLEAIFDPFIQASSSTTRRYGGTGLGLAIVKKLLELMGSQISVESGIGTGTVFKFTLQLALAPASLVNRTATPRENQNLEGLRILVAEDNHINVLLLEKLLKRWRVEWLTVPDGEEAVSAMALQDFDLVLMDIHMPRLDGYGAAQAIRKMADPVKSHVPIIALTASVSHDRTDKAREAGMQEQLSKPFQPDRLYQVLHGFYLNVPRLAQNN